MDRRRRSLLAGMAGSLGHGVLTAAVKPEAAGLRIEDAYSPRDVKRAKRPRTEYIILHTTEADDSSSFNSVHRYGSCHYLVHTDGLVRRIIHRDRIANHAGRSLWNGERNLSTRSIGIEIVGRFKDAAKEAQLIALKQMLSQLQQLYPIPDKSVLTHSQIAYSYHPSERQMIRGRRKDALQFADPAIRARIGLTDRWTYDPDERAGRVAFQKHAEGPWLRKALYEPEPSPPPVTTAAASDEDDPETFEGFLIIGVHGETVEDLAGAETLSPTTIYFLPDGRLRQGDRLRGSPMLQHPPAGLKVLVGYVIGGEVTATTRALDIAGAAWNYPSTFYRLPDLSITQGDKIDQSAIPPGTVILYRH